MITCLIFGSNALAASAIFELLVGTSRQVKNIWPSSVTISVMIFSHWVRCEFDCGKKIRPHAYCPETGKSIANFLASSRMRVSGI